MKYGKSLLGTLQQSKMGPNETTSTMTQLPANILEAFIPGYSVISGFLLNAIGFDITLVVSICALVFGLVTSIRFIWEHAYVYMEKYLMSYIRIDSGDDIFDHVMDWAANQKLSMKSRKLLATTGRVNAWDSTENADSEIDASILLNFSNWEAKVPPKFEPSFGEHYFFHNRMLFKLRRNQEHVTQSGSYGYTRSSDEQHMTITCMGRSTQPIKDLIKEAREFYLQKEKTCTVVRRPLPKEQRERGHCWLRVATRPSRPIHTVVLDHEQKHHVLTDINEYLHPSTAKWYSNRGIPYRRGYLFHGPPGTGKSSLAWGIAGVFGLDIYSISLVDPTLSEEHLGLLFTNLPRRCVVLLEDIDSAGLIKRQELSTTEQKEETEASKIGAEISKAIESSQSKNPNRANQGISLSGLLNVIDGVASHEGRVLVMTTNCPEKLDEALVRPGRIDMKVAFTNATRPQIRELFIRMYSPEVPNDANNVSKDAIKPAPVPIAGKFETKPALDITAAKLSTVNVLTPPESPQPASAFTTTGRNTPESEQAVDLETIATKFSQFLPEEKFSPAEVQGFLLTRKKEPLKALNEVESWRDALLAAKAAKKGKEEVEVNGVEVKGVEIKEEEVDA